MLGSIFNNAFAILKYYHVIKALRSENAGCIVEWGSCGGVRRAKPGRRQ